MKKSLFISLLLLLVAPQASQAVVFSGELSTATVPAGMTGSGLWGTDFLLKWEVSSVGTDWQYDYWLLHNDGSPFTLAGVSHVVVEISESATDANFWDFEADGAAFNNSEGGAGDYGTGNGNPNIPATIYGLKLDFGGAAHYSFFSDRAPVWGDFYAKDGSAGGLGQNAIWNTDFLLSDPLNPPQSGLLSDGQGGFIYKVLRPDSTGGVPVPETPEPSTAALAALGLAGFRFLRRRKK